MPFSARSKPASVGDLAHAILAPDQDGRAEPLVDEGIGGADDLLLLALGEDDAFGIAAHALDDALQGAGDRIAPRRQRRLIGVHIGDRPARDAGIDRRLGDGGGNDGDQARIEGNRDDVIAPEARPRALIGGGDFVGHVLAREIGEGVGGGDLHLHIDRLGAHVERAAENIGKAEDVIDLVGIVRAAGGDDDVLAHFHRIFRRDLGIGIGHGENDRIGRHRARPFRRSARPWPTGRRKYRRRPSPLRACARSVSTACADFHWFMPSWRPRQTTPLVSQSSTLLGSKPIALMRSRQAMPAAPAPLQTSRVVLMSRPVSMHGVDHAGGGDDRGAVLIVVEDGNVHQFAQALLDDETFRRLDVLEIDAAERGPEIAHAVDERLGVFGVDFQIDRIDVGEALEQHRLALHHRLGGERARDCRGRGSPCHW